MTRTISDYYRCPQEIIRFAIEPGREEQRGFFRFGSEATCYGSVSGGNPARRVDQGLYDAWTGVRMDAGGLTLPFNPTAVVDNLRLERYREGGNGWGASTKKLLQNFYYCLRPISPSFVRTGVQRMYYSRWHEIPFPLWPIDFSVDRILQRILTLFLAAGGASEVPFIWFWPDGAPGCGMMTHDIEEVKGRDFCPRLMDLDDGFGIKSSFQVVPEDRYPVPESFLESIRSRGFEINVHDLNHDGFLFRDRETFLARAGKINQYIHRFGASGFRAGAMYRQPAWYGALDVSYDMSVPNAAHMEPQRGGCCTVMPFFVGNVLELPLTTTQDFALIRVLRQHSCDLWKREIEMILAEHGLVSFIVHPDYMISPAAQQVYRELLAHLADLRSEGKLWIALPKEVNDWWRQRAGMNLVREGDCWRIEGPGSERARVAYARLADGRLTYSVETGPGTRVLSAMRRGL